MKTFSLNLLAGLLLFFAPIQGLLVAVGAAVVFDTFTGIYKSIKLEGLSSIKSRKLSNIVSKLLLYQMCIILLFPIDKFLLNELLSHLISIKFFATKFICVILIIIEGTSIKENVEAALNVNLWDMLKNAMRRAKEVKDDINELRE
jgi:hypothetical protein